MKDNIFLLKLYIRLIDANIKKVKIILIIQSNININHICVFIKNNKCKHLFEILYSCSLQMYKNDQNQI